MFQANPPHALLGEQESKESKSPAAGPSRRMSVEPASLCSRSTRHGTRRRALYTVRKVYRGGKDKNSTFMPRMDYSSTRRLLILRPVSF